jgi:hypothetical protein
MASYSCGAAKASSPSSHLYTSKLMHEREQACSRNRGSGTAAFHFPAHSVVRDTSIDLSSIIGEVVDMWVPDAGEGRLQLLHFLRAKRLTSLQINAMRISKIDH